MDDLREAITARENGGPANPYGYALYDRTGRRIAGALDTPMPRPGLRDIIFTDPREGTDPARAMTTILPDGHVLTVALDPEALERIDATILGFFGIAFVLVLAIGVGGALILGAYLRRRIERISGTARAIVAGDFGQRVPVGTRNDEFDQLARALNVMLDRIAQLLDNLRQVSSDVAHDLRTPLARLRNSLEAALDGTADRPALKSALKQSDELLSLFAAILRISEVEGGEIGRSFAPIDVARLAIDLCETYVPAVGDRGRNLSCRASGEATVRGDRELIAQALINLLDNAQAHTPEGTMIVVALDQDATTVRLSVADNGPGVAEEDRERIVHRFVRLEGSRSTQGNGLGLNLVAAIAAAHGGRLVIDDNTPGLRATIELPRATA
jgi:signal transduction histidine kinase